MYAVTIGGLHNKVVNSLYTLRVADDRLVWLSYISGEEDSGDLAVLSDSKLYHS